MNNASCSQPTKGYFQEILCTTGFLYRHVTGLWVGCCILFLLHTSALVAQTPHRDQLIGTWIGAYAEWDIDFFCPLAVYMRLNADSTYALGMVDSSAKTVNSTWGMAGNSVRLDTIHYAPNLVRFENGLLRIGLSSPMVFRRFQSIPIDSARAYKQLVGYVWQSDNTILALFANGRVSVENLITKRRTAHFWQLITFDTSVFLVIRGNAYNEEGPYKALWQLSRLSSKEVQMTGWDGQAVATNTFRLVKKVTPGDSYQPNDFQPCSNCFMSVWNVWNIASFDRPDERDTLKQVIARQYKPVCQAYQSGLLHIRFVVNCRGQAGPAQIKGYGDDYCPKTFDGQLVDQFLTICRETLTAPAALKATNDPMARANDVVVSVTFRLKDGQLTDILP